jgi:arginine decarboxylase
LDLLQAEIKGKFKIEFVSHLKKSQNLNSIRPAWNYKNIVSFLQKQIQDNDKLELKMLHFSSIQVLMIRLTIGMN